MIEDLREETPNPHPNPNPNPHPDPDSKWRKDAMIDELREEIEDLQGELNVMRGQLQTTTRHANAHMTDQDRDRDKDRDQEQRGR